MRQLFYGPNLNTVEEAKARSVFITFKHPQPITIENFFLNTLLSHTGYFDYGCMPMTSNN